MKRRRLWVILVFALTADAFGRVGVLTSSRHLLHTFLWHNCDVATFRLMSSIVRLRSCWLLLLSVRALDSSVMVDTLQVDVNAMLGAAVTSRPRLCVRSTTAGRSAGLYARLCDAILTSIHAAVWRYIDERLWRSGIVHQATHSSVLRRRRATLPSTPSVSPIQVTEVWPSLYAPTSTGPD